MAQTVQQKIKELTMRQVETAIESAKETYSGFFKSRPTKRVEAAKRSAALRGQAQNPQALLFLLLIGEGNTDTWSFKDGLVDAVLSGTHEMVRQDWPWRPAEERIALLISMLREFLSPSAQPSQQPAQAQELSP